MCKKSQTRYKEEKKVVRKSLSVFIFMVGLLLLGAPAFALTTGSGTLDITFEGAMPDLIQFFPNTYVGNNPGGTLSGTTFVTNGNSTASATLGGPTMYWKDQYWQNPDDYKIGTTSFALSAQVPAGLTSTSGQVDIGGYFLYGGYLPKWGMGYGYDIATLPAVSFTYHFNGQTDTADDRMSFILQTEIYNFINSDDSHPKTFLYSDYDPSVPNFRSKMPEFTYPGSASPQISETGTVSLGPYTEDIPHTWAIRFDFMGYVEDFATGTPTGPTNVPEPVSMLLLGLGLIGLTGIRGRLAK